VLDRSGSMGLDGRFAAARREALASLQRLPASARFQIIVYNDRPEALCIPGQIGMVRATEDNKQRAARFLQGQYAEGITRHLPALVQALAMRPDVVFFLTDADDLKDDEIRNVTQLNYRLNNGKTCINTLELTTANRGRTDRPLHVLARDNRGVYQAVSLENQP
jgi:hypothetical protein